VAIGAVVADANVLLSAVIGKAAQSVFSKYRLEVHVTEFNALEVEEYLPLMGKKYGLPPDLLALLWKILPLSIHFRSEYVGHLKKALTELRDRDPEDAHAMALARTLGFPLWSNDRHLSGCSIPCYTTAQLLRMLEGQRR